MRIRVDYDKHPDFGEAKQVILDAKDTTHSTAEINISSVLGKHISKVEYENAVLIFTLE